MCIFVWFSFIRKLTILKTLKVIGGLTEQTKVCGRHLLTFGALLLKVGYDKLIFAFEAGKL